MPLALAGSSSLNRFATEDLDSITGMFYDRETGGLYFTKDGSNRLHRRSFSPESEIVGGERSESGSGAGGVAWNDVETMFLAGGRLYTSSSDGNLVRRTWNAATGLPVTGTATVVSGPGVDGQNWRARDAFVFAGDDVPPPPPNQAPIASFTSSCVGSTCLVDSTASSDPDGTIVSRSWNWDDGTPGSAGTTASHTYAQPGTYTVTLTVTDDDGATGTTTRQVQATTPPPNQAPIASFTSSCVGSTCLVDSTASSDPDGTIVSRAWNWGDGTPGSAGTTASHTYAQPGTYTVTLTVTDDDGATGTTTRQVQATTPPVGTVTFRGVSSSNTNTVRATVPVPPSVQPGDVLLLFSTHNNTAAAVGGPAGWTLLAGGPDGSTGMQSFLWTKVAAPGDAGSTVQVTNSVYTKTALQLTAYSGAGGVTAHAVAFDNAAGTARTTPQVPVAATGSAVVSIWADKTSSNSTWSLPPGVTLRDLSVGSGGGRIVAALGDQTAVPSGTAGGQTASSGVSSTKGVVWSVVVAPSG